MSELLRWVLIILLVIIVFIVLTLEQDKLNRRIQQIEVRLGIPTWNYPNE